MSGHSTYQPQSPFMQWFERRLPALSLSHLNKIVRTGEVRVDGARVKTSARLAAGQNVRVPPLDLPASVLPPLKISQADRLALKDRERGLRSWRNSRDWRRAWHRGFARDKVPAGRRPHAGDALCEERAACTRH